MVRSLGFGFDVVNLLLPFVDLLLLRLYRLWLCLQQQLVDPLCKRYVVRSLDPPTACWHPVSGSVSLPCSGSVSPFPHGTSSLSVLYEYLGLGGGPPIFGRDCCVSFYFIIREYYCR